MSAPPDGGRPACIMLKLNSETPMIVTIELSDERAAALQAQAGAEGMPLPLLLQRLAEKYADAQQPSGGAAAKLPIWEAIVERMEKLPDEVFERLPGDGAAEHDHYLYGSPKRNQ